MNLTHNRRRFARRLISGTALVGVATSAMLANPAFADSECGATIAGTVTCPASGNPYPNGITYTSPVVDPAADPGLDPATPVYDLTVNLGDGVAIQSGANPGVAIFGFNDGAATLNSFGNTTIAASGTGALGVIGNTNYGDLTINTDSISVSGRASGGINANSNQGDIIINAGTTTVLGDGSVGISANSFAGNVSVTADAVSVDGYYAGGIVAYSAYGDVNINAGTVRTTADGSFYNLPSTAIKATTFYGSIDLTADTVSTTADYSDGIRAISYQGDDVTVTGGTISTAGLSSNGAFVQSAGNATLNVGSIATTGDTSYGAVVLSTAGGDVTVNSTGAITTTGVQSYGVAAVAINGGDVNVTVNDVATTGDLSPAIYAAGDNVSVTINGDVSTSGTASLGVNAVAGNGVATITNNGSVATMGNYSAGLLAVSNTADASVVSAGTVATTGDGSIGVYTIAANGDANATVNNVSTDGFLSHAVYAVGGSVEVTVNGDIRTNDYGSMAIRTRALDGSVTVTNNGSINTAVGGGVGIFAYATNGVTISGTGTIVTHGGGASGIVANGYDGPTTVTATSVTTSGAYSRGVTAQGSGDVTLDLGDVTTSGRIGTAIEAATFQNGTGPLEADLNVKVDNVTVNGDYSLGINAFSSNDGVINIDAGTVNVNGANGIGILSDSYTADTNINVGTLVTTGSGDAYNGPAGIYITSNTGDISVTSSNFLSTVGLNGSGVFADTSGNVAINVNDVTTRGDNAPAVIAYGGNVSVTINGDVMTSGANSPAVYALSQTGAAVVTNVGTIATTGAVSDGIYAVSLGSDAIVNSGSVLVRGAGSTAIRTFGGGANVNVTGAVRSTQATAINIIATSAGGAGGQAAGDPALDGIARLTVAANGSVQGGTNAITTTALNATQITNNGSILGGSGYAIQASGGAATITNNGTLTGRLLLTGNADRLTNTGTFVLAGSSDFGAGNDTLTNSGTVRLGQSASAQTVALAGLENFNNSGLLDLRTGTAGDRLTIGGYTGSGAATLGLDIAFGPTTTVDRLNVTTAAGSTAVVLNPPNGPATLIPATTIVQATAASSANAFTIASGSQNNGLIQFGVVYNPTAFAYQLVSAPNSTVYRQVKLAEGLASLWNRSADAVTAHLTADRDAGWGTPTADSAGRIWLQMYGEADRRSESRNFAYNGLVQNNVNLSYKQDAFGGQIGFDVIGNKTDTGGFTVGVAGGYTSSTMNFRGNDRFDIDAVNGTVYAGFRAGGLFINGLAKYDYAWINSRGNAPQLNFNVDTKARTYGGKVEAGFRLGSDTFFIEPAASIAYTNTDLNRYRVLGGRFDFDDFTGLRGKAGARIGGSTALSPTSTLVFYAGGAAVHEFKGEDRLNFTSGGQTIGLFNDRLGTYGQGTLGVNIVTAGGVTGFIEGHDEYGDDYKGGGGRAGIRIKF